MKPIASILALFVIVVTLPYSCPAQLFIGNSGNDLHISSGSYIVYDGLKITAPVSGLTISNTEMNKSSTPVGGMGGAASINRVYTFSNEITFSGNLDIFYSDVELNSNTESQLRIAYKRANNSWLTSTTSSVDATNNIVSDNFSSVSFKSITAAASGSTLPLLYNSFKGKVMGSFVELAWKVDQSNLYSYFEVQSSPDNRTWNKAGTVNALNTSNLQNYSFNDNDIDFSLRFYRLKLVMLSGSAYYSSIIPLTNGKANATNLISLNGGLRVWFSGWQPKTIQLYDMKGRLLKNEILNQPAWETSGLPAGIYMLSASNEIKKVIRKVLVQ